MPILSIIRPDIPVASKDKFLDAWPVLSEELRAQPGVLHATGGEVIVEDGQKVDEFKFIQWVGMCHQFLEASRGTGVVLIFF